MKFLIHPPRGPGRGRISSYWRSVSSGEEYQVGKSGEKKGLGKQYPFNIKLRKRRGRGGDKGELYTYVPFFFI